MFYTWYESEIGRILLAGTEESLHYLLFESGKHFQQKGIAQDWVQDAGPFAKCQQQLNEYFAGDRQVFDLNLNLVGTEFQKRVWGQLSKIPFGETISYAELASRIGQPGASRAVGSANGRNPISIIVPCHRVISSGSRLAGYGGGLDNKAKLLRLEGFSIGDSLEPAKAKVHQDKLLIG